MSTMVAEPVIPTVTPFVNRVEIANQSLNVNETKTHKLYTLADHRSSLLTVTVLVHDVNSDTNRRFFSASYAWYREWDRAPKKALLAKPYDDNTGSGPAVYTIDTSANGNDIQVTVSQSGFATQSYYTIVAEYLFSA